LESANVVGFTQSAIEGGKYYMCATHFDTTGGEGVGYAIKDLITGEVPYGTQIQVMQADTTYKIYYYIEEAYDENTDDFIPGWGDGGDNFVTTGVIPAGKGAWIKPTAAITATFASPL
jgi:hypothetical protein